MYDKVVKQMIERTTCLKKNCIRVFDGQSTMNILRSPASQGIHSPFNKGKNNFKLFFIFYIKGCLLPLFLFSIRKVIHHHQRLIGISVFSGCVSVKPLTQIAFPLSLLSFFSISFFTVNCAQSCYFFL